MTTNCVSTDYQTAGKFSRLFCDTSEAWKKLVVLTLVNSQIYRIRAPTMKTNNYSEVSFKRRERGFIHVSKTRKFHVLKSNNFTQNRTKYTMFVFICQKHFPLAETKLRISLIFQKLSSELSFFVLGVVVRASLPKTKDEGMNERLNEGLDK